MTGVYLVEKAGKQPRTRAMDIPLIEQVKIQARILVPLLRTLQAELGEARANELVRKALG